MAYIETHQALLTHRKTLRLSRLIGIDRWGVAGRLMALWSWALDNAQEGIIAHEDSDILADVMGWNGDPSELCRALVTAGFLDQHANNYAIHDWMDYAGRLIEKRKSDAERKRLARASTGHTTPVQRTSSGHPADGAGTLPYPTKPNTTSDSEDTSTSSDSFFVAADADDAPPSDVTEITGDASPAASSPPSSSEQRDATGKRRSPLTASPAGGATKPAGMKSPHFPSESDPYQLAMYLRDAIVRHKPDAKVPRDPRGLQSWAIVTDKMIRLDARDPTSARAVIDWATRDSFWAPNILSPGSLREKFDRLELDMARKATSAHGSNGHAASGYGGGGTSGHNGAGGGRSKPHAAQTIDEYTREMSEELARLGYGK